MSLKWLDMAPNISWNGETITDLLCKQLSSLDSVEDDGLAVQRQETCGSER